MKGFSIQKTKIISKFAYKITPCNFFQYYIKLKNMSGTKF